MINGKPYLNILTKYMPNKILIMSALVTSIFFKEKQPYQIHAYMQLAKCQYMVVCTI